MTYIRRLDEMAIKTTPSVHQHRETMAEKGSLKDRSLDP